MLDLTEADYLVEKLAGRLGCWMPEFNPLLYPAIKFFKRDETYEEWVARKTNE
jgi:hypothetical protein